jgi:ferredoxin
VDTDHAIACGKLLSDQGLTCTLLVIKKEASDVSFSRRDGFALLEASAASITGAFGGFSAKVTVREDQINLSEWFDNKEIIFDLVLDLQSTSSYAGDCLPMGYFAPGSDLANFHEAVMELPEMRGRFTKPQFMTFLENRCTHGRSRKGNCCQCLTVCPYGAIQSVDRKVSISHYLCQGCGGCALVCPAEAIRMVHPSQEELLNLLRSRLENRSAEDDYPPPVIISETETLVVDSGEKNNGHNVYFQVEQIGHVGLEMLLAALIYGAGRVVVACGSQDSLNIQNAVEWQTRMAGAILQGLGLPEDKIRFAVVPPENSNAAKAALQTISPDAKPGISPMPPPAFSPCYDKRTFIRLATQHLYDQSVGRQPSLPLPVGSPFGAVTIDSSACTLCTACAVNCPSGALLAGGDVPRLEFLESRCHQCGLCKETCPENAIQLQPRILCDTHILATPVVLCESEPFRCVECGVPFASQAMINRMQSKLTGHWMYAADRQIRRLQMCRICRTRDAFMSTDVKSWSQQ